MRLLPRPRLSSKDKMDDEERMEGLPPWQKPDDPLYINRAIYP